MKLFLLFALVLFLAGCSRSVIEVSPEFAGNAIVGATQPSPPPAQATKETAEGKAVRLAEEFVRRNGYTAAPADKEHLTNESIEASANIDEMLADRKNTLEPKAYGWSRGGKGTGTGWTVVFHYRKVDGRSNERTGRAVTMDEDFQNLRMQHVDFILEKVQKKL